MIHKSLVDNWPRDLSVNRANVQKRLDGIGMDFNVNFETAWDLLLEYKDQDWHEALACFRSMIR